MLADAIETVSAGCRELIEALDEAAVGDDPQQITRQVSAVLSRFTSEGLVHLSDELREPCASSYARRLIYRSEQPHYTALAMVWGPGQGTPVHDHSGMWCVEGVVEGSIEVTQYDLKERQGDRCRFESQATIDAGVGSSGRLIPPFDYHTISNASDSASAITIHVYGGEMESCMIYEPVGGGWYRETVKDLSYSD